MAFVSQVEHTGWMCAKQGAVRTRSVWLVLGALLVAGIAFGGLFVHNYLEILREQEQIEKAMRAGEYEQAEELLKAYKTETPEDLTTYWNLALVYGNTDRSELAKREIEELLKRDPTFLGALEFGWLASLYSRQGNYPEAEAFYKRASAVAEKSLAPDHPDAVSALEGLADVYYLQGKYSEAESLMKQTLAIQEKLFGPDHPATTNTLYWLAYIEENLGQYEAAEALYKQLLAIWERTRGPNHASVAAVLMDYAALLRKVGRVQEAESMEERVRNIRSGRTTSGSWLRTSSKS